MKRDALPHCVHCLCKPVISKGIKLRHTGQHNFREMLLPTGGGLNGASHLIRVDKGLLMGGTY